MPQARVSDQQPTPPEYQPTLRGFLHALRDTVVPTTGQGFEGPLTSGFRRDVVQVFGPSQTTTGVPGGGLLEVLTEGQSSTAAQPIPRTFARTLQFEMALRARLLAEAADAQAAAALRPVVALRVQDADP